MAWSPQQEDALRAVGAWLKDRSGPQVFRLFGYAGTGKTTLAKHFAENVRGQVVFGAFTGKAALVLRNKGCHAATTIHSMIYSPVHHLLDQSSKPEFVINRESEVSNAALVVIDECSMVDEKLGTDLLSFGAKVLVLGDPAQLPPVNGQGFFTNARPDVLLTEVHRQALDNPIISMSMKVRNGEPLDVGTYGASAVISRASVDQRDVLNADQILVGRNRTRMAYNSRMRTLLKRGDDALPVVGDKLVCLRNDRFLGLLNGGIWTARTVTRPRSFKSAFKDGRFVTMSVLSEDIEGLSARVRVLREFFEGGEEALEWEEKKGSQEFTYGYALTVHKSQGSQWSDVYIFDESSAFRDDARRWLYTAITRAAERVTIVR
jgi:exodeoxyribonuclease-5